VENAEWEPWKQSVSVRHGAPQVWVLDIRLVTDNNVQLYIEDGEVFEVNLSSKDRPINFPPEPAKGGRY